MRVLAFAMGLSALLAAPATAATIFAATATSTIGFSASGVGLAVTYSGTYGLGSAASGTIGAGASAEPSGADVSAAGTLDPATDLTFGAQVNGATPSNPDLDTSASAFYERGFTITVTNTTSARLTATFSIFHDLFAEVTSDGLPGEKLFAQATFQTEGDFLPNLTVVVFKALPLSVGGTETGSFDFTFDRSLDIEGDQSKTLTVKLRVEGAAEAAAVTPVPIPASASLLAAALLGAGALLRRRRAA